MLKRTRRSLPLLAAVLLGLVAIACTGDDEGQVTPAGDGEQATATQEATPPSEPTGDTDPGDVGDDDSDASDDSGDGHAHGDGGVIALTMAAVDAADTAGFHGMQETLEETGEINERWTSTVANALTALRAVPWDESLEHGADEMIAALEQFEARLESGDPDAALEGAVAVHEAQHHFSPEIYAWLAEQNAGHDDPSTMATGLAAIDIIDSAGFHGMGDAISEAGEISGRQQSTVTNALAALHAASWPEESSEPEEALTAALEETATAMEAGDVGGALDGLHGVHDAQHELSSTFYGWLAANHADIDHSDGHIMRAAVLKSVDMINSVGLHAMAEALGGSDEINERFAGQIERMVAIFSGASQHGAVSEASEGMLQELTALLEALESGDLEAAREAAEAAHEAQHDLSHDIFAFLQGDAAHVGEAHEHGEEAGPDLSTAEVDTQVTVEMSNFAYEPETITVQAGSVVELTVENTVDIVHDFTIDEIPGDVFTGDAHDHDHGAAGGGAEHADLHVGLENTGSSTIRFRPTEPGEYTFYCTVPGHRDGGMVGTLVVTD